MAAEEQRQWQEAAAYYLKALPLFTEFQDAHNGAVVMRSLARLAKDSGDQALLARVADALGARPDEVKALFTETLPETP